MKCSVLDGLEDVFLSQPAAARSGESADVLMSTDLPDPSHPVAAAQPTSDDICFTGPASSCPCFSVISPNLLCQTH